MDWRGKRQIIIFLIGVGVIILLASFVFDFGGRVATCFDGRKNGDESGVDCGGPCPFFCAESAKPLVVHWSRPFFAATGVYNAAAYIENSNQKAGVSRIRYEFRLYDSADVLVAQREGATFILPNQNNLIFEPNISVGEREPLKATLRFLEEPSWFQIPSQFVNLPILINEEKISGIFAPHLEAVLTNNSLYDLRDLKVAAIIYDKDGNALASSTTLLTQASAKGEVPLQFSWNTSFAASPARIEIIPEPDIFNIASQ